MRMSTHNIFPNYSSLTGALNQQAVALTAAELHDLISCLLCGGSRDASSLELIHDLTNDGAAFPQSLSQPLQQLYETTHKMLEDDEFMFQPLLAEGETVSVFERADALAGWVNHFLLGLGIMQPKLAQVKGEVGEAIDDLRNIAQLGYDEDEDQETLKQSLEEVVEYVRVAAILHHTEFTYQSPIAPESIKPMLHSTSYCRSAGGERGLISGEGNDSAEIQYPPPDVVGENGSGQRGGYFLCARSDA